MILHWKSFVRPYTFFAPSFPITILQPNWLYLYHLYWEEWEEKPEGDHTQKKRPSVTVQQPQNIQVNIRARI